MMSEYGNKVKAGNVSGILWRGVAGGLLGNAVKSAIFWLYFTFISTQSSGYFSNTDLVGAMLIVGIPSAVVMGILIVAVIRGIKLKSGRGIGIFGGAAIGVGIMGALVGLLLLIPHLRLPVDNISSWVIAAPFYGDFGIIIGAVAGMMAGQRDKIRLR